MVNSSHVTGLRQRQQEIWLLDRSEQAAQGQPSADRVDSSLSAGSPGRESGYSGTWPRSNPGLAELSQGWSQASLGPSAAPLSPPSPPPALYTASQALGLHRAANKYNVFSIPAIQQQRTFAEFYFDLIHRTKKVQFVLLLLKSRRDSPDPK